MDMLRVPMSKRSYSNLSRRALLVAAGSSVFAAALPGLATGATQEQTRLSVSDAHRGALSQDLLLLDIRTPGEWAQTGLPEGGQPLDMQRPDFLQALDQLTDGDTSAPIALICATGGRSGWLSRQLKARGYSRIIDVPEGMFGSSAGPGWIRTGLPVVML